MTKTALALLSIVFLTMPARADEPALQLGVGGYIEAYGVYADQDETVGDSLRKTDFRKYTEVHFFGDATLDNGVKVGARVEASTDRSDVDRVQESYFFISGKGGRVNVGEEDGATHLLQVEAPSGDELVDGVRPHIGAITAVSGGNLNYAHDDSGYASKITYLTPVLNGFQAGVSFTPSMTDADLAGLAPAVTDDDAGEWENGFEMAARYEGSFDTVDVAIGAGYSVASLEEDLAGDDDPQTWNLGANAQWGAFGIGGVYLTSNNGTDNDMDTIVAGIHYTAGPVKVGASYLNTETETAGAGRDLQADRWSAGVIYDWASGMTWRGSLQYQEAENVGFVAGADGAATQVSLGSQIRF